MASMIQRAAASQKRLNEFLAIQPTIHSGNNEIKNNIKGNIIFENVDLVYPHSGVKAVADFNLEIKAGQKVLILGKTGSGKSSIAQLISRMYDPTKGKILIDGQDIKSMPLQAYRKQVGYVQQDVFLFSDSIMNNVQFGLTDLTNDNTKHIEATKTANVYNEINQLPNQFQTTVGERGTTLSGGQKQRISIARSIIKEPSIFVFDDCLSAVDTKTEQSILKNLASYIHHKTAIFITHRIFFTYQFDVIIYLDEGKIVEIGTHESLLAKKGLYAELYSLQQTQENS